ncbi:MAG TPA: MaoC family dehydratase N-terminal domain-containing protein [Burkholderiales bacterium]|nr:MaoC family dehydratase N-terminal domain-containing protein [Burkholderiales bacterium]
MGTEGDEIARLREWIGRKESRTDVVSAWPAAALAATLDRDDPAPTAGEPLPPGWHWLYFLEARRASELGPDGHCRRGEFLPPVELPRRMWAGGRIEFRRALRIGEALRRDSEIVSVEPKRGRSGRLVFVTVRHTILAAGEVAVIEEHDIVYREAARPAEAPARAEPAPQRAAWRRELLADPVMLFRFSALTFNGHRIHYDLDYCRAQGYPGLVVHGPLQVILLLDLCRRHGPRPVARIEYRALHPVFHFERMAVNGEPAADGTKVALWTSNAEGHCAMSATACFA